MKKIEINWPKYKKGKGLYQIKQPSSTKILINGITLTCIVLSIVSGFIDLVFFSNLSKSFYGLFGLIEIPAGIVLSMMSVGFTMGKFFCQMQLGAINELQSRLKAGGFGWYKNLKKDKIKWNLVHKFLIAVSVITSISLSVISIGTAIRDTENNTTNITLSIEELQKLKEQLSSDKSGKRELVRSNITGSTNAKNTVNEEVDRKYPYIEEYVNERNEFINKYGSSSLDSTEIMVGDKTADQYWSEKANDIKEKTGFTASVARTFDSKIKFKNYLMNQAKQFEMDSDSVKQYEDLSTESKEEINNTILALQNHYKHPDASEKGIRLEEAYVTFVDEEGNPVDISRAIGILQGLREEWKNNTDIGDSAEMFMLISEIITARTGKSNSSGLGPTELTMMIMLMLFGIIQEFLIALFTPKTIIDRKMLSRFSGSLEWKDEEEKEKFLLRVYKDYVGDGIITESEYEQDSKKCVELMEDTLDDVIGRYSKKNKDKKPAGKIELTDEQKDYLKILLGQKDVSKETIVEKPEGMDLKAGLAEQEKFLNNKKKKPVKKSVKKSAKKSTGKEEPFVFEKKTEVPTVENIKGSPVEKEDVKEETVENVVKNAVDPKPLNVDMSPFLEEGETNEVAPQPKIIEKEEPKKIIKVAPAETEIRELLKNIEKKEPLKKITRINT